jgi:hexosaminidase
MMRSFTVLLFLLAVISYGYGKRPRGPSSMLYIEPTLGQPWPKPQSIQTTQQQFAMHPAAFHFMVNSTSQTCDLLTSAFDRYYRLIFFPQSYLDYVLNPESINNEIKSRPKKSLADLHDTPLLKRLNVHIQQPCDQYPSLQSDESCKRTNIDSFLKPILFFFKDTLTINDDNGMLESVSIWGTLRGLETFSQIVYFDDDLEVNLI